MKLGGVQLFIICRLGFNKLRTGDLAHEYITSSEQTSFATVSRALSRLHEQGIVDKEADYYYLTEKGLMLFKERFPEQYNSALISNIKAVIKKIKNKIPDLANNKNVKLLIFGSICYLGEVSIPHLSQYTDIDEDILKEIIKELEAVQLLEKHDNLYRLHQKRIKELFDRYM